MKLKLFSVRDHKAEMFQRPFVAESRGVAQRALYDVVNGKDHEFARHPGDFELFELGEFDQEGGELVATGRVAVTSLVTLKEMGD